MAVAASQLGDEPPELPSVGAYRRLSPRGREDVDERRFDYHSALVVVRTPQMTKMHETMRLTVQVNRMAPPGARRGDALDGQGGLGKSTILKTFGRDHERRLRRRSPELFAVPGRDFILVVYVSLPDAVTSKGLSESFADYLALPVRKAASTSEVTNAVLKALRICGTEVVLIDDIHFLDCSQKDGKLANDHLKYLANYCAATFIYAGVGVRDSGLFNEGRSDKRGTQTGGCFSVLSIEPFGKHLLRSDRDGLSRRTL